MSAKRYARSGVDVAQADRALARLILEVAPTQAYGARNEVGVGHFAAVIRAGPIQIALTTDGVGSKLLVAQALERYESVGIDCVAMNVNDLLCVGARPLAMLDYIACEVADPEVFHQIGRSLAEGARQAGISIVGGETAMLRDMLKGAAPGRGLDVVGMGVGLVPEGEILDGARIQPGDAILGVASNGLHSNGFSLARDVLLSKLALESYVSDLGTTLGEEMLRPVRIYVTQVRALREAGIDLRSLAHITGDGLLNMRRVEAPVGFELTDLPEPPAIFALIERIGGIDRAEMRVVFNMGVGLVTVVPADQAERALQVLKDTGVEAWRIGRTVADPERRIWIPREGLVGKSKSFAREG
jgi:phosphoribosylformylglycinamidine cyclo-ligase